MQLSSRDPLSLHKLSAGIVAGEGGKLTALPIRGIDVADLPHAIAAKTKELERWPVAFIPILAFGEGSVVSGASGTRSGVVRVRALLASVYSAGNAR